MATLQKKLPKIHRMFRGDVEAGRKSLAKRGIHGLVLNQDKPVQFMNIAVDQLEPLLTQRETTETWTTKRLKDRGGFDMLACGALQVAQDPRDGRYYVFDGCGRLAQAQENQAPKSLPCLVYSISREQAAYYFAYNQDRGRRTLSKEIIFVNAYYSGSPEAVIWASRLKDLDCYIKGTTDYAVPHPQQAGSPEIKYRALTEAWRITAGDITVIRQARDMIVQAWQPQCDQIRQDLFLGLITLLMIFPEMRKNGLNRALQGFLNWTGQGVPQHKISWKQDGGNEHNNEAVSVSRGIIKAFRDSQFFKPQFGNTVTFKRIDEYQPRSSV